MVKTITIADDVYEELVRMKGNKSFSELLREMIKEKRGNLDVLLKLAKVVDADRLEKVSKEIEKEFEKWKEYLTQA
ncbi:antitoxin VapB family protein [Archaeoglobus sp.]